MNYNSSDIGNRSRGLVTLKMHACLYIAAMLFASLGSQSCPAQAPVQANDIIAIISDGDQDATSYTTGMLADPSRQDWMTLWRSPLNPHKRSVTRIEAANSNFSPSGVAVLSRDARRAYVVETMRRPKDATRLNQLVPSNRLLAFDIADPAAPKALPEIEVGLQPRSLDLSGDGRTVVVLSKDALHPLTFAGISAEGLLSARSFTVPGVEAGFDNFAFVQWSPAADVIAVHIANENRIVFLSIDRAVDGSVTAVRPFGNPVLTNKYPLAGRFTPDGRHYVTSDVNWGEDARGAQKGVLTLIRVGEVTGGQPRNFVADLDITGISAESFAISPDGQNLVASNIEMSGVPVGDPRHNSLALLTLYRIDSERSRIGKVGEARYVGALPQGVIFDADGKHIFVGVNELPEDRTKGGVLIFRLDLLPVPKLIDTGQRLEAAPGVHSLAAAYR
ncbi:hypothetical protein [Tardiphaga sp. 619_E2_N8_5]|uniref:hypothetical protein n=1 Tax=unclassified Tardiphaga TaxID=2631404 RepID=UPI003F2404B4